MFEIDSSIWCSNIFFHSNILWNRHVWNYNIKIIVYWKVSPKKPIYSFFDRIYLLESNIRLQKIGFQSYLHLKNIYIKFTFTMWKFKINAY